MANQIDVNKIFKEKFESFELENSPNIEITLKKKIITAKYWTWFKWFTAIIIASGISMLILLPNNENTEIASEVTIIEKEIVEIGRLGDVETKEKVRLGDEETKGLGENEKRELSEKESETKEKVKLGDLEKKKKIETEDKGIAALSETKGSQPWIKKEEIIKGELETERLGETETKEKVRLREEETRRLGDIEKNEKTKPKDKGIAALSKTKESQPWIESEKLGKETERVENGRQEEWETGRKRDKIDNLSTSQKISLFKTKKTNSIQFKKLNTKPKEIENKLSRKANLSIPKIAEPLPYIGLSKYQGFGEISLMPFLFYNTIPNTLELSDTIRNIQIEENANLSYQVGLAFTLKKREKPWSLGIGLNYQNYKEKIDYKFRHEFIDHELSFWNYDSIFEYHIDPPLFDTVLVGIDSNYVEHWIINNHNKSHVNSYTFLNIPLLIAYEIKNNTSPFSLQVSAGASLSILLKNKGYLYNHLGRIIDYNTVKTSPIITWGFNINTTLNYQLKNGSSLFVRPSFHYQFNKTSISEHPLQRKYFTYGISLGYRFKVF